MLNRWAEAAAGGCFQRRVVLGGPAVAPGGRGSMVPGVVLPVVGIGCRWSARLEGMEAADRCGDLGGPGPSGGEAEPQPPAAADEAPGDTEQPQPQALGIPPAGRAGPGEHLGPRHPLAGPRGQPAPEPLLALRV